MFRVGVDLGGTNISVGVIDENIKIVGRDNMKTSLPRSEKYIFDDIINAMKTSVKRAGISMNDIKSVGIGVPGSVNVETGAIEYSNNLEFNNAPIKQYIQNIINKPVYVSNDANCAALAEKELGAGKGASDFIALTIGTGIGGGIFVNNKMLSGVNGAAGEVGHMVMDVNGVKCSCGRKGCWEQYASATALIEQTKDALSSDKNKTSCIWKLINNDFLKVNGKTSFDAMRMGDKLGTLIFKKYINYLACGITNLINLYQPEILCIGGGISNEGDTLLKPVTKIVEQERYSRHSSKQTKICIAKLKNDAGIIGAALLNEI